MTLRTGAQGKVGAIVGGCNKEVGVSVQDGLEKARLETRGAGLGLSERFGGLEGTTLR